MKIYIDFDGTLFDTNKLYKNFINFFKKYNINEQEIQNLMKKDTYQKEKSFDILAKQIINENKLNSNILQELDKIYTDKLLYKDTIPFLEKYYKKYDLILLTLGNISHQQKKINSSNISKYFKDIIITNKDKSKLNINYNKGIFIDNNPEELKRFKNSKANYLIRIKRDNDYYSKIKLNMNNVSEFKDFKELEENKLLEKIGEIIHE